MRLRRPVLLSALALAVSVSAVAAPEEVLKSLVTGSMYNGNNAFPPKLDAAGGPDQPRRPQSAASNDQDTSKAGRADSQHSPTPSGPPAGAALGSGSGSGSETSRSGGGN